MRNRHSSIIIVLFCATLLFALSCASKGKKQASEVGFKKGPIAIQSLKNFEPRKINEVAVLTLEGENSQKILDSDLDAMTSELIKSLQINTSLNVFNASSDKKVKEGEATLSKQALGIKERGAKLGKQLGVQGVICGVVNNNDALGKLQDEGKVTTAVGFKLWLIDVASGAIVWEGAYSYTNQSLTDNILNAPDMVGRKLHSRTPREMLKEGFADVAKDLEERRNQAFSAR